MKELKPRYRKLGPLDLVSQREAKKLRSKKTKDREIKIRAKLQEGYCLFKDLADKELFLIESKRNGMFKKDLEANFFQYDDPNAECLHCGGSTFIEDLQIVKRVKV